MNNIEYDPNPLQSLGKRNKQKTNSENNNVNSEPATSANSFSFQHETGTHQPTREEKEAYKWVHHPFFFFNFKT